MTRAYKAMAIVGGAAQSIGTWHVEEHGELGAKAEANRAAALWMRIHGGYAWVIQWTDADAARLDAALGIRSGT
jgi:hypothetical protein